MALGAADTGSRGGPRGQRPLRAGQGSSARRCHLPTGVSEGAAGIVAALPTCRPVAFNCSLSVTGVLREVVVCPVTSRLAPQHLDSVVTWRTLRFLCPGARPLGAFCPRARVHCAFPSSPGTGGFWARRSCGAGSGCGSRPERVLARPLLLRHPGGALHLLRAGKWGFGPLG